MSNKVDDDSPFGCQISEMNLSFGGIDGYSLGKLRCALKNPPSLCTTSLDMILSAIESQATILERVWRAHHHHLPLIDVRVVDQTGREALDRVFCELCKRISGVRDVAAFLRTKELLAK